MHVFILGGGPGGYVAAIRAAQLGATVTLAEQAHMGGTCLHVGCIPTKVLLHATHLLQEIRHAGSFGIETQAADINWGVLQAKKDKVASQLTAGVEALLKSCGVRVLQGSARFLDDKNAVVFCADSEVQISFDRAIIATGSQTVVPTIPGVACEAVIDSEGALNLAQLPESLVIIGGGVIGVEMATVYARLGSRVVIVEAMERILPGMDEELVAQVARNLKKLGIRTHTGCRVDKITEDNSGATVHFTGLKGAQETTGEKILVSVGRTPRIEGLGLEQLSIRTQRGAIVVDKHMRTTMSHVYAIGDCTGGVMLAHVASKQGIVAAENAVEGDRYSYDGTTVPACVYTEPELACVGLTEAQARERYSNVKIGSFGMLANGKTMIMGGSGLVKWVVDGDTDRVLGLHILAPRATDMIGEGALALRMGATIQEILSTVHAHPTVAEGILEAAADVLGRGIHKL